jgi:hypothetical protein
MYTPDRKRILFEHAIAVRTAAARAIAAQQSVSQAALLHRDDEVQQAEVTVLVLVLATTSTGTRLVPLATTSTALAS